MYIKGLTREVLKILDYYTLKKFTSWRLFRYKIILRFVSLQSRILCEAQEVGFDFVFPLKQSQSQQSHSPESCSFTHSCWWSFHRFSPTYEPGWWFFMKNHTKVLKSWTCLSYTLNKCPFFSMYLNLKPHWLKRNGRCRILNQSMVRSWFSGLPGLRKNLQSV